MSSVATKRLRKEFASLLKDPVPNIVAVPLPANILEWHYIIFGPSDSPYAGGVYHGIVRFPSNYPYAPPSIQMLTPNGRFVPRTRLCLSMSDFHPETWNPMWSVASILTGLLSFMIEETPTYGSVQNPSNEERRRLAAESMQFNKQDSLFCELFSSLFDNGHPAQASAPAPASSPVPPPHLPTQNRSEAVATSPDATSALKH